MNRAISKNRSPYSAFHLLVLFVALVVPLTACGGRGNETTKLPSSDDELVAAWEAKGGGVFVHLFEWPWADIAIECEQVLGPAGYAGVQISPPNEHFNHPQAPWWQRYQPVSYQLQSRSGSQEELVDMIERCEAVGVAIYADVVINHMAGVPRGIGSAGTEFTKYSYPETWSNDDFRSPPCGIVQADYTTDATAVRECELVGLSDLRTDQPTVREGLANYLIRLISLGIKGFRIDAAKHMAPQDVAAILELVGDELSAPPYVFLEVIDGAGEVTGSADYLHVAVGDQKVDVTDFGYLSVGARFRSPVRIGELAASGLSAGGLVAADRAVIFTDNHDTQRHDSLSYRDGVAHQLANVFLLAHEQGYPKLMSSYSFTPGAGRDDGPPHTAGGETLGPHHPRGEPCVIHADEASFDADALIDLEDRRWVCEHRNPALVAMLGFRRATWGAPVVDRWSEGEGRLAFGRMERGFVVINHSDDALHTDFVVDLPDGPYCNILGEKECERVEVEGGKLSVVLGAHRAWAIHVEARP